jgi:signal peptidase I
VPVDSCVNPIQTPANNPKSSSWLRRVMFGRNLKLTLLRVLVWAVLAVLGYKLSVVHVRVDGISMLPTCPDQAVYWVNRLAYVSHPPQRGDVVALRFVAADDSISRLDPPHVMLLKRIIGLPGETVAFVRGQVLINGEILDEPYETMGCDWNRPPVTLGPDEYFVVGDNRSMPWQDHTFGVRKRNLIVGKARL